MIAALSATVFLHGCLRMPGTAARIEPDVLAHRIYFSPPRTLVTVSAGRDTLVLAGVVEAIGWVETATDDTLRVRLHSTRTDPKARFADAGPATVTWVARDSTVRLVPYQPDSNPVVLLYVGGVILSVLFIVALSDFASN